MRKEVVFAIIIGLVLGGIILFGFQIANQSAKEAASPATSSGQIASPTPLPSASQSNLGLTEPLDHAVVNTSSIKISGKTLPNSTIAVESETDDALLTADENGGFTTNFKLTGGENLIRITALLPDQKIEDLEIVVVYTTAKLASLTPPDLADVPIATDSQAIIAKTEEEILQAAKDRSQKTEATLIAKANNILVGYAGSITDIKQGVFSLDSRGVTLQISYDTKTALVKNGVSLKPDLLAVGDKALIIGNLTSADIVAAKRIVIYKETTPKFTKKTIFSPIVKIDVQKKTLTLKVDDKNREVALGKLTKLDLTTLTLNQKLFGIIMTGVNSGTTTLIQAKVI